VNELEAAIATRLKEDTTLIGLGMTGVHRWPAPEEAPFPYVVFQPRPGRDRYTLARRAWEELPYQIEAIDKSRSAKRAGQMGDRIDALFTDQPLAVTARNTLYARRQTRINFSEHEDGVVYQHGGGVFAFWEA